MTEDNGFSELAQVISITVEGIKLGAAFTKNSIKMMSRLATSIKCAVIKCRTFKEHGKTSVYNVKSKDPNIKIAKFPEYLLDDKKKIVYVDKKGLIVSPDTKGAKAVSYGELFKSLTKKYRIPYAEMPNCSGDNTKHILYPQSAQAEMENIIEQLQAAYIRDQQKYLHRSKEESETRATKDMSSDENINEYAEKSKIGCASDAEFDAELKRLDMRQETVSNEINIDKKKELQDTMKKNHLTSSADMYDTFVIKVEDVIDKSSKMVVSPLDKDFAIKLDGSGFTAVVGKDKTTSKIFIPEGKVLEVINMKTNETSYMTFKQHKKISESKLKSNPEFAVMKINKNIKPTISNVKR